jgi:hypothetical protein
LLVRWPRTPTRKLSRLTTGQKEPIIMTPTKADFARWRRDPVQFFKDVLRDPKTKKPFRLYRGEIEFLRHAFQLRPDGRLLYPELVYSKPKKAGKSGFAAMLVLYVALVLQPGAEVICCANDFEQSQGRVFKACCDIVKASPLLRGQAQIKANRIYFPATGALVTAIASEFAGAAGSGQHMAVFDELWGYTSERSRRLWEEMIPPPIHQIALRLTVTYAGFSGESLLLEDLYRRAQALPLIAPDLHAGNGMLFYWSHSYDDVPWVDSDWIEQQRASLSPGGFAQKILNEWTSSEAAFIDPAWWAACTAPDMRRQDKDPNLPVWVGVDASYARDSSAVVCVAYDQQRQKYRMVRHRVFYPESGKLLDFESTIEAELRYLRQNFFVRRVYVDPFQMIGTIERLAKEGLPIERLNQTPGNQTRMTENLFDAIRSANLAVYFDDDMTLAIKRCVVVEDTRGHKRLAKVKGSHHIDSVVGLAMALLAATEQAQESEPAAVSAQRNLAVARGYQGSQLQRALANLPPVLRRCSTGEAVRHLQAAGACAECGRYGLEVGVRLHTVGPNRLCGECMARPRTFLKPGDVIVCTRDMVEQHPEALLDVQMPQTDRAYRGGGKVSPIDVAALASGFRR